MAILSESKLEQGLRALVDEVLFHKEVPMQQLMSAGTVLFRDGTIFPEAFKCESDSYSHGWRSVKNLDGDGLDRRIREAGWHFFYFAGENKITVPGRECEQTMRKAIERILAGLTSEKTNSLEITRVAFRSFLGVPFTSVFFHMRTVQKSMFLLADEAIQPWKDAGFIAA